MGASNVVRNSETITTTGASNKAVATTAVATTGQGAPQPSSRDEQIKAHANEEQDAQNVEQIQKELFQLDQEYEHLNQRERQLQQAYDILLEEEACLAQGILIYVGQEQQVVEKQSTVAAATAKTRRTSAEATARATDDNVNHDAQAIRRLEQALLAGSSSSSSSSNTSDEDNDEDGDNGKVGNYQDDP